MQNRRRKHSRIKKPLQKIALPLLLLLAALCLNRTPAPLFAQTNNCTAAVPSSNPSIGPTPTVCISIIADGSTANDHFAVSWISSAAESGQVNLISSTPISYADQRGAEFIGKTHYVDFINIQPNTVYQFDIVSGGTTYDNNGAHWSFNSGPALATPTNHYTVLGHVKNPDGSDADEALVYIVVNDADGSGTPGSSALLSQVMTADDAGFFHIDLSYARISNFSTRFLFSKSGDKATITAIGAAGSVSTTVNIADIGPGKPTLILNLGTGTAATATPSPKPPTATSTPIIPTAPPTLPADTATAFAATQTAAAFTATPSETSAPPSVTLPRATAAPRIFTPTLTLAPITIAPAAQTSIAEATAFVENSPEPEITRVGHPVTPTPPASTFVGVNFGDSALVILAVLAFVGAAILGGAAVFVWKK